MGGNSHLEPLKVPIFFWLTGMIIGKYIEFSITYLIALILFLFSISLFKLLRNYVILFLFLFLGIVHIQKAIPEDHIAHLVKDHPEFTQPIEGRIISEVKFEDERVSFILSLQKISNVTVQGKIKFFAKKQELRYGDVLSTVATIRKVYRNSNPASFDYQEYLRSRDIHATGYANTTIKLLGNNASFAQEIIIKVRKFLRTRIEERSGKYSGLIKAIMIADKSERKEWQQILNRAGLSHLLAVSGLHVGIIYLFTMLLLQIIIPRRLIARLMMMIVLIFYAGICNWTPSVTRASIMISFYLLAKILQRKVDPNYILLLSLFIITIFKPEQLFTVGLQLSFSAVFVLLNVVPRLKFFTLKSEEIALMSWGKKLLNGIAVLLFTSLILNLFLNPLVIYYFKQCNFNGLIGNLLGIPLISFILPLSFIVVVMPELSFLIEIYQGSLQILLQIFEYWSNFSAALPLCFDFVNLDMFQLFLVYSFLLSLSVRKLLRKYKFLLCCGLLCIFFASIFAKQKTSELKVTFFDCGLGDLHLIETTENERILIDTGPTEKNGKHFKRSAFPYFQKNTISSLDWLIVTHAHNDHYGGLKSVLENIDVKNLIVTDEFQQRKVWENFRDPIMEENCKIFTITDTLTLNIRSIKLKFLHPDKKYFNSNRNNCSLVCRLDYGDLSILFTGDMEAEAEEYLMENYAEFLDIDILKIGHHGSRTSSTKLFIKKTSPEYGLIPTSLKNRFGFPHKTTLEKFRFLEQNLFITGRDGALQIVSDGKSARFCTFLTDKCFWDKKLDD